MPRVEPADKRVNEFLSFSVYEDDKDEVISFGIAIKEAVVSLHLQSNFVKVKIRKTVITQ